MTTQLHITRLSLLTILCFALTVSAFAGTTIFSEGPIDGLDNALFIDGPNPGPFSQSISNGFFATNGANATTLDFGEWVSTGTTPTTVTWWLGTSPFGSQISSGTASTGNGELTSIALSDTVYLVQLSGLSGHLSAGQKYWLTLGNANDSGGTQFDAWDIPDGGLGGPASCEFAIGGIIQGGRSVHPNCGGVGGESFTLSGSADNSPQPAPEPSGIMLFGSGILGIAGVLRRKLMG